MKRQMTITQEEKDKILNILYQNPCGIIHCQGIPCEACPLREVVKEYNLAVGKFIEQITKTPVEVPND